MVHGFVDQQYRSKIDIWPFQVEPTMGHEVEVGVGRRAQTEVIPWTMGRGGVDRSMEFDRSCLDLCAAA